MRIPSPRFLLPLIIFVSVVIIGLRVGDVEDAIASGKFFARPAMAETKTEAPPETKPEAKAEAKPETKAEAPAADAAKTEATKADAAPKLTGIADDASPAEMEVLKQLSNRREELDKRGRDLDTREALIKVAEQRVENKIKEMETLRQQLQAMVNTASEAQAAQLENLVKIYETMKPDEAARIFETLEMPVLLSVIQRMKPARTAPVMAKMAPDKAKDVTLALTKQDKLPQVK
ncbi:MAG: hypothetical protein SFW62_03040 [Alphaproteobacteria bacterium]|nr:hypothetical protein [Alphaproteobacteria bacterium]